MGVTGHWLNFARNHANVERVSVALALRRFPGVHSYDRIGELLQDIMVAYKIDKKVVCVVTDNGSNFVKAFKQYGREYEKENGPLSKCEETQDYSDSEDEGGLDPEPFPLVEEPSVKLPPHVRCASHTLSLVATKDLELVKA